MSGLFKSIASKFKLSRNDPTELPISDPTTAKTTSDDQSTSQLPTNEEYVSVEVNQNGDPIIPDAEADVTKEEMADFFNESKKGRKNIILRNENVHTPSAANIGTESFKALNDPQHNPQSNWRQQQLKQSEQSEQTGVVVSRDKIEYKWYNILKFKPFRRTSGNLARDNQPHSEGSPGEWHIQTRRRRGREEGLAGNC